MGKYRPDKPKKYVCTVVVPDRVGDCDFFLPLSYVIKNL